MVSTMSFPYRFVQTAFWDVSRSSPVPNFNGTEVACAASARPDFPHRQPAASLVAAEPARAARTGPSSRAALA